MEKRRAEAYQQLYNQISPKTPDMPPCPDGGAARYYVHQKPFPATDYIWLDAQDLYPKLINNEVDLVAVCPVKLASMHNSNLVQDPVTSISIFNEKALYIQGKKNLPEDCEITISTNGIIYKNGDESEV